MKTNVNNPDVCKGVNGLRRVDKVGGFGHFGSSGKTL